MSDHGLPCWRAATSKGFDSWAAGVEKTEASLTLASPYSPNTGPACLPEWGTVCCSVGTRAGEQGRAGEGSCSVSTRPVSRMGCISPSSLALKEHPLGVPFWSPNRLFTEQGQRAENIPASSTPSDPLPPGIGRPLGSITSKSAPLGWGPQIPPLLTNKR